MAPPRSAGARIMYDREQYEPLPNFAQPTSAAGATNLYFRKHLETDDTEAAQPPARGAATISPVANLALEA